MSGLIGKFREAGTWFFKKTYIASFALVALICQFFLSTACASPPSLPTFLPFIALLIGGTSAAACRIL
jgi:hypothetical protein